MKYVYLANNRVGYEALRWLIQQNCPPSALVVHPAERGKYCDEIIALSGLSSESILAARLVNTPEGVSWLRRHEPEILLTVYFGYILKADALSVPARGGINLHPALLPYNRGAHPDIWSIIERAPAGATIHYLDEGIDTGDVIDQVEVTVSPSDTAATLYYRLENAALELFKRAWPEIRANRAPRRPQQPGGSSHRVADLERIDRIDPNEIFRARDLIDRIRARTFAPYKGAYLDLDGRRVYMRLELWEE